MARALEIGNSLTSAEYWVGPVRCAGPAASSGGILSCYKPRALTSSVAKIHA